MNPVFTFRFDIEGETSHTDVLVFYLGAENLEPTTLSSEIDQEIDKNLVPDEVVILVQEPRFSAAKALLADHPTMLAIRGRLRDRARVTLLGYDYTGRIVAQSQAFSDTDVPFELDVEAYKRRALSHICQAHKVFVEATPSFHFENPSGRHTEHFIRLSNILVRGVEISFVGFCLLPHIPEDARLAYLDTPSLYAVVSAVNDHYRHLLPTRPAIVADNFRSYMGLKNYSFRRKSEAVVLISASSSGGLARGLMEVARFSADQIVHVLSLSEPKGGFRFACDLRHHKTKNPEGYRYVTSAYRQGDCKLCSEGSKAITLHGDQFDIAGPQPDPLLILKTDLPKGMESLLPRVVGKDVFRIGLGNAQSGQPRLYHVETAHLAKSREFAERLDYVLTHSVPAKVRAVVYLDTASKVIAQRIIRLAAAAGRPPLKAYHRDDVSKLQLGNNGPVVVVAGVIESGRSLLDISRDLRNECRDAPLHYVIGIDKSTGEARRETLSKNLVQCDAPVKHGYVSVEQILLPGSFEAHPWLLEREFLKSVLASPPQPLDGKLYKRLSQRVANLDRTSIPLTDAVFLSVAAEKPLELRHGFAFWPKELSGGKHSQADVYFTVASVLQNLRAKSASPAEKQALRSNWFQQSLLAPGNFGRYNDGIIQASLLRAASPSELNYAMSKDASAEMRRIILRMLSSFATTRGEGSVEFLLALACGRMSLAPEDLEQIVDAKGVPPILALLAAVARKRVLKKSDGESGVSRK